MNTWDRSPLIRLLVSVCTAEEAEAALVGGADIIDVKEPTAGALGRADAAVWRQVLAVVGERVPVSVALGELSEVTSLSPLPAGLSWAKVGLAGEGCRQDWPLRLRSLAERLRPTPLVPVAYADWQRADAPSVEAILTWTLSHAGSAVLVDTWRKDGRRLLDWLPLECLASVRRHVPAPVLLALAGRLRLRDVRQLVSVYPDIIAVRGLVCAGSQRQGQVSHHRVATVRRLLSAISRPAKPAPKFDPCAAEVAP
jgi:uncharacterized protein (UPF0264 family)